MGWLNGGVRKAIQVLKAHSGCSVQPGGVGELGQWSQREPQGGHHRQQVRDGAGVQCGAGGTLRSDAVSAPSLHKLENVHRGHRGEGLQGPLWSSWRLPARRQDSAQAGWGVGPIRVEKVWMCG